MVIWISGLSGTGKTTLGTMLYNKLKKKMPALVMLDGDMLRAVLGQNVGHDAESRRKNSIRYANLCQLLNQQDIHVICCAVSMAPEAQQSNREKIKEYIEIYLDVALDVLKKRDPKGIYEKASKGEMHNVAGVDIPYIPPSDPHLVIDNNEERSDLSEYIDQILGLIPPQLIK